MSRRIPSTQLRYERPVKFWYATISSPFLTPASYAGVATPTPTTTGTSTLSLQIANPLGALDHGAGIGKHLIEEAAPCAGEGIGDLGGFPVGKDRRIFPLLNVWAAALDATAVGGRSKLNRSSRATVPPNRTICLQRHPNTGTRSLLN